MSKKATASELRTECYFKSVTRTSGSSGSASPSYANVFGEGKKAKVKWVNAHGTDALNALQMENKEIAMLTMRYSPLITKKLVVFKGSDMVPFEIVNVDNVEERNEWLELKVQRTTPAR